MIVHSACFWLKKDLTDDQRAVFESELCLPAQSECLAWGGVGKPAATKPRPVTDHTFDFATSFYFKSLADHDRYQSECPDHARFVEACKEFWERVVDFHGLAEEGVISPHDLDLITWVETAEEAWDAVCRHYEVC